MSDGDNDPSVHLTVGVDTHIWGLNYQTLRAYTLARAGVPVGLCFSVVHAGVLLLRSRLP